MKDKWTEEFVDHQGKNDHTLWMGQCYIEESVILSIMELKYRPVNVKPALSCHLYDTLYVN